MIKSNNHVAAFRLEICSPLCCGLNCYHSLSLWFCNFLFYFVVISSCLTHYFLSLSVLTFFRICLALPVSPVTNHPVLCCAQGQCARSSLCQLIFGVPYPVLLYSHVSWFSSPCHVSQYYAFYLHFAFGCSLLDLPCAIPFLLDFIDFGN